MTRNLRIALAVLGGLVVLLAGIVAINWLLAPDGLRRAALDRVSSALGGEVSVADEIGFTPSLTPTIVATEVSVANAPWGDRPRMFFARRLEIELQLVPLLFDREVRIDRLVIDEASLFVESGPAGVNWLSRLPGGAEAAQSDHGREGLAALTAVTVRDSRLAYTDLETGRSWEGFVERLDWRANALDSDLVFDAVGRFADRRATLRGSSGAIATLLRGDGSYPIDLRMQLGEASLIAQGKLGLPVSSPATDLTFAAVGLKAELFADVLSFDPPLPGPYEARGRISAISGSLGLTELEARAGRDETVRATLADGVIRNLVEGTGLQLPISLKADSLRGLGERFRLSLPALGSVDLAGRVTGSMDSPDLVEVVGRVTGADDDARRLEIDDGRIENLPDPAKIDLPFRLEGSKLAKLGDTLRIPLPALGGYQLRGTLTGTPGDIGLTGLAGTAGQDDGLQLRIENGKVADLRGQADLSLPLRLAGPDLAGAAALIGWDVRPFGPFEMTGVLAGTPETLALEGFDGRAGRNTAATIEVSGTIGKLRAPGGLDLEVAVDARSLEKLRPLIGLDLPAGPPLRLSGIVAGSPTRFTLKTARIVLADTTAAGRLEIAGLPAGQPQVSGHLRADQVDLDTLSDQFGWSASPNGEEGPVELPLDLLDAVEADLALETRRLFYRGYRFEEVQTRLVLDDGQLSLNDVSASFARGTLSADLFAEAEPGSAAADVTFKLEADDLQVAQLLPAARAEQATGTLDIDIAVDATGRTIDELIGELEGDVTVLAEEGRLEGVPLNRLVPDLDIFGILPFFQDRDPRIRINCLIGEFDVDQGVAETDALLDTQRMTLLGEGSIDLDAETLELTLQPRAKSRKLSQSEIPIDIRGSLTDPNIEARVPEAVGGAIRGFFGGLLVPLNQISALFGDEAIDACGQALRRAAERKRNRG